jgi:hypothetical protein
MSPIKHVPCAAYGCCESAGRHDYCIDHSDLIYRFHMWLMNANGSGTACGSFDAARIVWERAFRAPAW